MRRGRAAGGGCKDDDDDAAEADPGNGAANMNRLVSGQAATTERPSVRSFVRPYVRRHWRWTRD